MIEHIGGGEALKNVYGGVISGTWAKR